MQRRQFIMLIGGAAAAWPLAARAQQGAKPTTIGLLGSGTPATQSQWTAAFVQRMSELGWIEGRNLTIEYRWAGGHIERLADLANELVRLKVDVIVTHNTPPPLAAKQATSVIPIVFATAADPVGTGIVASLARPGGNVTGLSSQSPDTAGKRLDLLRQIVPGLHRLAFLGEAANPYVEGELREVHVAARSLGLEVTAFQIQRGEDIAPVFEALNGRAQALLVSPGPLIIVNRIRINTLAVAARLPTMHFVREDVEAGGLMAYFIRHSARIPRRIPHDVDLDLADARHASDRVLHHDRQLLRGGAVGRGERHVDGHRAVVGDIDLVDQADLVDVGGNFGIVDGLERADDLVGQPREFGLRQRRRLPGVRAGRKRGPGLRVSGRGCRLDLGFVRHAKNPCALIKACARPSTSSHVL
jgi:putative tryptophan/tyrosine transport system substrate-binding protein